MTDNVSAARIAAAVELLCLALEGQKKAVQAAAAEIRQALAGNARAIAAATTLAEEAGKLAGEIAHGQKLTERQREKCEQILERLEKS